MQKIRPCLWFNQVAEEAINFYVSVFKNSKIDNVARYGEAGPGEPGSVLTIEFTLEGQEFMALNAGPSSSSRPRFRSTSTARHRKKSTTCGRSSPPCRKPSSAAGFRTNTASRGRSSPRR